VRLFASEHVERVAALVLVDASHEDQQMEMPPVAPFVPFLSSVGAFRLLGISFGPPPDSLAPPVQPFARATAFRASAYQATADEGLSLRESAAEVRAARRKLAMPVVVLTAGLGSDAAWQDWQRDQVGLSEQGCQKVVAGSGHGIAIGRPEAVVDAIHATVQKANGRADAAPCG
jgi:pimeloyl-ACP methyl ester carboxylesterase